MDSRPNSRLWQSVDTMLERTDDPQRLRAQGLSVLAAKRLRRLGAAVDPRLAEDERVAGALGILAPVLLNRIRAGCDGEIVVIKGPEVARLYPGHARSFGDLDILVRDAAFVQRTLVESGFVEIDDSDGIYVGLHHRRPLVWPGLPLRVEVHSSVKWPSGLASPTPEALFEGTVPSELAEGVSALAPEQHALVLAAHAWAHRPLRSIRDLIDVAVVAARGDEPALEQLARSWHMERLWRTTSKAIDGLFFGARRPLPLRLWARHLPEVRERVVVENHLERWIADTWGLPPRAAAAGVWKAVCRDVVRAHDESWGEKVQRAAYALTHPFVAVSKHDHALGPAAYRGQGRNVPGPDDL